MLQKAGGSFTLTADVNFGPNFGLLSQYFTSRSASPATNGVIRLAQSDTICFGTANIALGCSGTNQLTWNGNVIASSSGIVSAAAGGTGLNTSSSTGVPTIASGTWSVASTLPISLGGTNVSSVTTAPTAGAFGGWDANKNFSANNFLDGYSTTATAGGTTTLSVSSAYNQFFTGSSNQTVTLPVVSTLVLGQQFLITNLSTGTVTVQSSGANTIQALPGSSQLLVTCTSLSGTGTASWSWTYVPAIGGTLPIANGGTGQTSASAAFNALAPTTTKGDIIVYTGSTNTRQPIGSDGQVLVGDSTQTNGLKWTTLNQGAKNYITYGNFENNSTTGWSLNHSTLSSNFPNQVSGSWTAASGNLAFTTTSSGKLAGSYSGQLASSTATTAGDMLVSQAYTIDTEDQAKVLTFKFYYSVTSGASNGNFSWNSHELRLHDTVLLS